MSDSILIVDDSLTVRMDLHEAFSEAGFDATPCATAFDAREAMKVHTPQLIILDVILPDADGIEFLAELREQNATRETPVILLSNETEVKDRIRGLARGASEYVGKPYDADYVLARAKDLLRNADTPGRDTPVVLIIDDSLTYREELSDCLENSGFQVALASSGEEGMTRAAQLRPDAIVVDGVMPGMDGCTVVRRIRLDPGLYATPCLLLTASDGAASEVVALDAGADAYVRKGEGTQVILARLGGMLRSARESRDRSHIASLMGPQRILAVDDSPTYLEEISEQLRADGYEVVKARSGEEALELLAVDHADCILLDLLMPGLSGTETCKRIKCSNIVRNIPLIMLTALDDPEAVIEGMNAGADDYVAKSVEFDVIKARLRAQLRRKQFEDENRRIRDEILRKDAETRAAKERAKMHAGLLAELEQKNRDLEILNEELQSFAYSVSHDLRQPLRAMDGFGRALMEKYDTQLDERGRHYVERIRAGAQRMNQLIEGLLVLSRVTRKELTMTPVRIDLLARSVLQRLQVTEPHRNVTIDISAAIEAFGDLQLIESVLENLLGNAWKFTVREPIGRIEVGVDENGQTPVYHVTDNGTGFKMAYADNLFAPFQRLHSDKDFPGTGIGLATTQRIVHRHGGRIWAHSEVGQGTKFCFTLCQDPVEV